MNGIIDDSAGLLAALDRGQSPPAYWYTDPSITERELTHVSHNSGNKRTSSPGANGSASHPFSSQTSNARASRPSPTSSRQVTKSSTGMSRGILQRIATVFFRGLWISRSPSRDRCRHITSGRTGSQRR
jgi:hypothetical protein